MAEAPGKPSAKPPLAEPAASKTASDSLASGQSSRPPRANRDANACANPPENHEARLISIIQELVRQPRVQPVSARVVEPTAEQRTPTEPTGQQATPALGPLARSGGPHAGTATSPTMVEPARSKTDAVPAAASAGIRITQAPAKKPANPSQAVTSDANGLDIFVKDEDIRQVLALLGEAGKVNILPSPAVTGNVSLSLANVGVMEALEAILKSKGLAARREGRFIYVGTPEEFAAYEKRKDRVATRIYRPNYVTSAEIKSLLTPLLSPTVGKISVTAQAKIGIESNDNQAGGNELAGREAVLVQDFESVLVQMDRVVLEIDRRPLQVAIEAMILSVKLDDEHECGVDFQFLRNQGTIRFGLGAPADSLGGVSFTDGGLKFAYLDGNIGMFIKALETVGDTNVISTPRLLTLNKQRAEILIGAELGYVTTTVTETTATQSIDFLSVGTQLRIRPFISSDGMIRMEIHPELSTGQVRVEGGMTLPDKEVTKVTTNIMVRDGSTVIIGGLMREDLTKNARHVPFLGSLPTIGGLFGSKEEKTERREILVLVTPRIVYDDELHAEGEESACEFHRRQNVFGDSMSPVGRTYLGRKYFRLAQEAWAAGDAQRAKRYVSLSIHINPSDRAAIDLRSDIAAGVKHGAHALHGGTAVPAEAYPPTLGSPPVYLNEEAIEAAPHLLPPGAEQAPSTQIPSTQIPSTRSQPPRDTSPGGSVTTASAGSSSTTAPSSKAPAARKTVFPVRAGRKP
jgi:type IV pilus assembly protein PilQ